MRREPCFVVAVLFVGCGEPSPRVNAPLTDSEGAQVNAVPALAPPPTRVLRVGLYPYVPDPAWNFENARRAFEKARPGATIEAVRLGNYYKSTAEDSAMRAHADVIELDSVFMVDAVKLGRVRALP